MQYISEFINILLVIVTLLTVKYASQTLFMDHSPQVTVSYMNFKISRKDYYPYSWNVNINNYGNGILVKAFILMTFPEKKKRRKKVYFLSKPVVGVKSGCTKKIRITLREDHLDEVEYNNKKIEVIYQDSLGNLFVTEPPMQDYNLHLRTFDKLPKKLSKRKKDKYNKKLNTAYEQNHTYPERLDEELKQQREKLQKSLKMASNLNQLKKTRNNKIQKISLSKVLCSLMSPNIG